MIEQILPAGVAVAEAFTDPDDAFLFPEEEAQIAAAVPRRRREFTTVRHCARTALARLGHAPVPILPGPKREPRWPAGVVGSMTHCDGYRAAALGRVENFASIGIDAEPHAPLPEGVFGAIALPGERDRHAGLAATHDDVCWDRLLFCAKEAVYKTWYPLTQRWLDFAEADIVFDPVGRAFTATLLVPGPMVGGTEVTAFTGRFAVVDGLVAAAICLAAPTRPAG